MFLTMIYVRIPATLEIENGRLKEGQALLQRSLELSHWVGDELPAERVSQIRELLDELQMK